MKSIGSSFNSFSFSSSSDDSSRKKEYEHRKTFYVVKLSAVSAACTFFKTFLYVWVKITNLPTKIKFVANALNSY